MNLIIVFLFYFLMLHFSMRFLKYSMHEDQTCPHNIYCLFQYILSVSHRSLNLENADSSGDGSNGDSNSSEGTPVKRYVKAKTLLHFYIRNYLWHLWLDMLDLRCNCSSLGSWGNVYIGVAIRLKVSWTELKVNSFEGLLDNTVLKCFS